MTIYTADLLHSSIEFRVKHLMITTVTGRFSEYTATIETVRDYEDFNDSIIQFCAAVDSVNTGVIDRDNHLKSAEIFDTARWPRINYMSKTVVKNPNGDYDITGTMTLKGVTKDLKLRGVYKGSAIDLYGVKKYGFEVYGNLSRKDFDLHICGLNGSANSLVDDKVKLIINAQMTTL